MVILFRVDSSNQIGHGHIIRCLNLAIAMPSDCRIIFICQNLESHACNLVKKHGYEVQFIPITHEQNKDAQYCLDILKQVAQIEIEPVYLIVDHYNLDIAWEYLIKENVEKLIVIDDLANRKHYCDILIDQSLVHNENDYNNLIDKQFIFIGGGNIVLRPDFYQYVYQGFNTNSILICMGGADPNNITYSILTAIKSLIVNNSINVTVIIGSAYHYSQRLSDYIKRCGLSNCIRVMRDVENMAELLSKHALAIVSCGTMVLESCVLGVPTIGISIASNQLETGLYLERNKAISFIDSNRQFFKESLEKSLSEMLNNCDLAKFLNEQARKIIAPNATQLIIKDIFQ